jgi:hypothetical protein
MIRNASAWRVAGGEREAQALRAETENSPPDLRALSTLIHSLRTALVGEAWGLARSRPPALDAGGRGTGGRL